MSEIDAAEMAATVIEAVRQREAWRHVRFLPPPPRTPTDDYDEEHDQ